MLFNSIDFFVFLALVLIVYYCLKREAQNVWILVASYTFYAFWDWRFLTLIAISTVVDYFSGKVIGCKSSSHKIRKIALIISICVNLGLLCLFKYFNFFIDSFVQLSEWFGLQANIHTLSIILPVGISFYTFQTLSYTIDIYRGDLKPTKHPIQFAAFVAFFPQLVAGPIERARNLLPQFQADRRFSLQNIYSGSVLILFGLFKKVVIADNVAIYVDRAFSSPESYTSSGLLVATILFSIQIYCDFSGYSDIARGVARLLGFELMVNFKQPYFSKSITEFWRRWHISLSSWLRDYLYISLGGNRVSPIKTYRNLFIVMLLGGLWHGAAWGFVLWGALHGAYLAVHKYISSIRDSPAQSLDGPLISLLKVGSVFLLVSLTWIPFRQPDVLQAWMFFKRLIGFEGSLLDVSNPGRVLEPGLILLASTVCLMILDLPSYFREKDVAFYDWHWMRKGALYAAMVSAVMLFGGESELAFIYFQF